MGWFSRYLSQKQFNGRKVSVKGGNCVQSARIQYTHVNITYTPDWTQNRAAAGGKAGGNCVQNARIQYTHVNIANNPDWTQSRAAAACKPGENCVQNVRIQYTRAKRPVNPDWTQICTPACVAELAEPPPDGIGNTANCGLNKVLRRCRPTRFFCLIL